MLCSLLFLISRAIFFWWIFVPHIKTSVKRCENLWKDIFMVLAFFWYYSKFQLFQKIFLTFYGVGAICSRMVNTGWAKKGANFEPSPFKKICPFYGPCQKQSEQLVEYWIRQSATDFPPSSSIGCIGILRSARKCFK